MHRRTLFRSAVLGIAGLCAAIGMSLSHPTSDSGYAEAETVRQQAGTSEVSARPLVGASQAEVEAHVQRTFAANTRNRSGTPRIRLIRPITNAELGTLGIGKVAYPCAEPPLIIAVIEGDFDVTSTTKRMPPMRFAALIYSANTGVTLGERWSGDGSFMRDLLNDPSLPPTLEPAASPVPSPLAVVPVRPTPGQITIRTGPGPESSTPPGPPPTIGSPPPFRSAPNPVPHC
jgi:hypothetical protein